MINKELVLYFTSLVIFPGRRAVHVLCSYFSLAFLKIFIMFCFNGFLTAREGEFCYPFSISRVVKGKIVRFVNKVSNLHIPLFGISRFNLDVMSKILTSLWWLHNNVNCSKETRKNCSFSERSVKFAHISFWDK